jgi:hypothetical protein
MGSYIPDCPVNSILNEVTQKCEENTETKVCLTGYKFDNISNKCIMPITPECPPDYTFNDIDNKCIKLATPICPYGYIMSSDNNCIKIPRCPSGHKYHIDSKTCRMEKPMLPCPPNSTFDSTKKKCINQTDKINNCKSGTSISNDAYCVYSFDPQCEDGYTFSRDNGTNMCSLR